MCSWWHLSFGQLMGSSGAAFAPGLCRAPSSQQEGRLWEQTSPLQLLGPAGCFVARYLYVPSHSIFIHSILLLNSNCLKPTLDFQCQGKFRCTPKNCISVTTVCTKLRRKHLLPLKLPVVGVNLSLLSLISISATIVGYVRAKCLEGNSRGSITMGTMCAGGIIFT